MPASFPKDYADIADSMGISLYQRFSLHEAALFLRCPITELKGLVKKKDIEYIQVSKTELQLFGYQLVQHLQNNIVGLSTTKPPTDTNTQDRVLRAHEVQKIVGLSRSTIWRLERKGDFPDRLPLSIGSVGWLKSDIEIWVQGRK